MKAEHFENKVLVNYDVPSTLVARSESRDLGAQHYFDNWLKSRYEFLSR